MKNRKVARRDEEDSDDGNKRGATKKRAIVSVDDGSTTKPAASAVVSSVRKEPALVSVSTDSASKVSKKASNNFGTMGLNEAIMSGIQRVGYVKPTPVQKKVIPVALRGQDVVVMAKTGSGKTAAFVFPILERLKSHSEVVGARALILSPTRDLAIQTVKFIKKVAKDTGLRVVLVVGGDSMAAQFSDLSLNPDIIVATPGRLLHHIVEAGVSFKRVEVLVLDEADRMFEMGFSDQIMAISKTLRPERQTMLFSATLPTLVYEFARIGLNDPHLIRLEKGVTLPPNVEVGFFVVSSDQKIAALTYLFKFVIPSEKQALVFCSTKHAAIFLKMVFEKLLMTEAGYVYGSMDSDMRKINVDRFRSGRLRVLLVTDVAARGIDIPELEYVVNFDLAPTSKIFVHRAGRVGRGNRQLDPNARAFVFSLVAPVDLGHMCDAHMFLGKKLKCKADAADGYSGFYYGGLPPFVLDEELHAFQAIMHDVNFAEAHRVYINSSKNYFRTRPVASKEGATMSKSLTHVPLHPVVINLGIDAGADPSEAARVDLVHQFLGSYRPKETALEVEWASDASKEVMQLKRVAHPEIRKRARAVVNEADPFHTRANADEDEDEDEDEDGGLNDDYDGDNSDEDDNNDNGNDANNNNNTEQNPMLRLGNFTGAYKDPKFFLSYMPSATTNKAEEEGLRVRDSFMTGDRGVIMDMIGDDEQAVNPGNKLIWHRKKKKFIGVAEGAGSRYTGVNSSNLGTKALVNEAGKRLTKKELTEERGKVYEQWMKKSKRHIQVAGEIEDPSTASRYESESKRARGRLSWANKGATPAPAPQDARGKKPPKKELRSEKQLSKYLKQKEKNKQQSKGKQQKKPNAAPKKKKGTSNLGPRGPKQKKGLGKKK